MSEPFIPSREIVKIELGYGSVGSLLVMVHMKQLPRHWCPSLITRLLFTISTDVF